MKFLPGIGLALGIKANKAKSFKGPLKVRPLFKKFFCLTRCVNREEYLQADVISAQPV
jgi:hypothetical protein